MTRNTAETMLPLAGASAARGTVVVIDVLRAFTTAAVAFAQGALEIEMVTEVDEALRRREQEPDVLLMGEVDGAPVEGFDLSNSPTELEATDLRGRRLVHRSTAGTRGAVEARHAELLLAGSFVVAEATVRWLRSREVGVVTYLLTGVHGSLDGDEDRAFAEYLAARLRGEPADVAALLERVRGSDAGRRFTDPQQPQYRPRDLEIATDLDRYGAAIVIQRDGTRIVARPGAPPA